MAIKVTDNRQPTALSVGLGLYKGNPLALIFKVDDDDSRPIGVGEANVVLDGNVYKIFVKQSFFADWIPSDVKVNKVFTDRTGGKVFIIDSVEAEVSDLVTTKLIPYKPTDAADVVLWGIPRIFAEDTVKGTFETYKDLGETLTAALVSNVIPTLQDTVISAFEPTGKPSEAVSIALTKG